MLYAQLAKIQSHTSARPPYASVFACKKKKKKERTSILYTEEGNCERFIKRDPNWLNHLFSRVVCFRIEFSGTKLAAGTIRGPTKWIFARRVASIDVRHDRIHSQWELVRLWAAHEFIVTSVNVLNIIL